MIIEVIGCGNAFSKKNYTQSFLLKENDSTLLIDCGTQTPSALLNAGYTISDIDYIYISHQHADHIGGLEEVAFTRYDWINRPTVAVPGKNPTLIANEALMVSLWEHSLRGGLQSMEGFEATLNTFFNLMPIAPNKSFEWQGWQCDLIQQIHVMAGNMIMHTYGLFLRKEGHKSVYFTTDSQHCSPRQVQKFYKDADIIFQDCEIIGCNFKHNEGAVLEDGSVWGVYKFGSSVHANYAELAGYRSANAVVLPADIKAKMWLSHYQDFMLDNEDNFSNYVDWECKADNDGFAGFVHLNQTFAV